MLYVTIRTRGKKQMEENMCFLSVNFGNNRSLLLKKWDIFDKSLLLKFFFGLVGKGYGWSNSRSIPKLAAWFSLCPSFFFRTSNGEATVCIPTYTQVEIVTLKSKGRSEENITSLNLCSPNSYILTNLLCQFMFVYYHRKLTLFFK